MSIPRNTWFLALVLSILGAVLGPAPLAAHPHVYIDARVEFRFHAQGLNGFLVEWTFDRMFTAQVAMDHDTPRNGRFPDRVVDRVRRGAFDNLQHYDYFTYVVIDGREQPTDRIEDFDAFIRDGRLIYRFFVPFRRSLTEEPQRLRVRMYDKTFYVDMQFHDQHPALVTGDPAVRHSAGVSRNEGVEVSYNAVPEVRREGDTYTGIAHPYEIVLDYQREDDEP